MGNAFWDCLDENRIVLILLRLAFSCWCFPWSGLEKNSRCADCSAKSTNRDMLEVETELDLSEEGWESPVFRKVPVLCLVSLVTFLFSSSGYGMCIEQQSIQQFWDHAASYFVWGGSHPGRGGLPCGLYGDEAKYTTSKGLQEKVLGLLFNLILWCPSSTRSSRYLLFAIRQSMVVSAERTLWPIYAHYARQLNLLFEGIVIGGQLMRFCLVELRGDWAFHAYSLGLGRRWNGIKPCFKCNVTTRGDLPYTDFSETPAWTNSVLTHVGFLLEAVKPGRICDSVWI